MTEATSFTYNAMSVLRPPNGLREMNGETKTGMCSFQMPLHYPKYKRKDYEEMPEWKVDCLLRQYGLPADGDVHQKRNFAMGAFLWKDE